MSPGRIIRSILALPFMATVVIPLLLCSLGTCLMPRRPDFPLSLILIFISALLLLIGLGLMVSTVTLFTKVGRGTLAPWDPTENLVVQGPYRYLRNPMISGVFFILLGESLLFRSPAIFVWFAIFMVGNLIYIPRVEETRLEQQFGPAYRVYKEHVPPWIPRLSAWEGMEYDQG
jgi:protein-S-isoprenylcysteine O-methyltransferase Ste14